VTASDESHAFAYANGVMYDLGTLGGSFSVAFGVNSRGHIVGASETAQGDVHAFVFRNGVMHDIDAFLPR
jgi:probable HAF family extracellular repeat protein